MPQVTAPLDLTRFPKRTHPHPRPKLSLAPLWALRHLAAEVGSISLSPTCAFGGRYREVKAKFFQPVCVVEGIGNAAKTADARVGAEESSLFHGASTVSVGGRGRGLQTATPV